MSYISDVLTDEEFFKKCGARSKASEKISRNAIINLHWFCKDKYRKTPKKIIVDLKKECDKLNDTKKACKFLAEFLDWLGLDHPDIIDKRGRPIEKKRFKSKESCLLFSKKYLRLCGGIRIHLEDYKDFVTIPPDDDEEEPEPLTHDELKILILNTITPRRKTMYMVMKDTAYRIGTMVQVRKKHFDTIKEPPILAVPKALMKEKRNFGKKYVSRETTPGLRQLLKNKKDDDLVFGTNEDSFKALAAEETAWTRLVHKVGMTDKYSNGRLKKNMHSIKSFCETQIKEATKDKDYADAYGDHARYLPQYIRLSEERKIQLFRQAEPYLSIFEKPPEVTDQSEEIRKLEERLDKYSMLDKVLESIEQPELEKLIRSLKNQAQKATI